MGFKIPADMNPDSNIEHGLGGLVNEGVDILGKSNVSRESPIHQVVADIRQCLEDVMQHGVNLGVPTGLTDIDRVAGGLQPSDLIIVAGRPSMGKSAIALNIAYHAARYVNVPTEFFSLEMSKEQLGSRLISSISRMPTERVGR